LLKGDKANEGDEGKQYTQDVISGRYPDDGLGVERRDREEKASKI